jgi:hypothetical protein
MSQNSNEDVTWGKIFVETKIKNFSLHLKALRKRIGWKW